MKCKRIIKVVCALALTLALLVSSGVVGFAAEYKTTTTYKNQDTIEVKSVATDLSKGDMVTYVAYNNDFSDANAVYIDQATADANGEATFTYQTSSDNVKATVKFGGSTETSAQDATKEGYDVFVTVDEGEAYRVVVDEVDMTTDDGDAAYGEGYLVREIPVNAADGKAIASVSVNGNPVEAWYAKNDVVYIYSNVILADGTTVEIVTADADVEVKLGTVKAEVGKITAFAKATCAQDADYGIIVGGNATLDGAVDWDKATDYTGAVKLPALGMGNDGSFSVEVRDNAITAGAYKVAAYAGNEVTGAKEVTVVASAQ